MESSIKYPEPPDFAPWRRKLHTIIYGFDTPLGKFFDVALIVCILLSVAAVLFESVAEFREKYFTILFVIEWIFTLLFSFEYILRLLAAHRPVRYVFSFFGVVDLLAIIPTYLSFYFVGAQALLVIRALRLLRVFRIFKLNRYLGEADILLRSLIASREKIIVFLYTVLTSVVIMGALMYLIEGGNNGFSSIPMGIYWAIVTMTTVGYGDIAPQTALGQFVASIIMIMGYGLIAVPTGIVSVELSNVAREINARKCTACVLTNHPSGAKFCHGCGSALKSHIPA